MHRVERVLRVILDSWEFWAGVAYFGLVLTVLFLAQRFVY